MQPLGNLFIFFSAAVKEDFDFGTLTLRVPRVLCNLQMGKRGAVFAWLGGPSQVHVPNNIKITMSRKISQSMYLLSGKINAREDETLAISRFLDPGEG